jgi:hypothetical protein
MPTTTPLPPVPATYIATRQALQLVAEQVVSPVRAKATGSEIALQVCPGGFGTPPLPDGSKVGVDGDRLSVTAPDGTLDEHRLTTLHAAAEWAGLVHGPMPDAPLHVDATAADLLATVFTFGDTALRALRAGASPDAVPSPIRLWPEHFDIAYEEGDEAAGTRAGYGVSPGDDEHSEPYAYVTPCSTQAAGPLWNATGFAGAELTYEELRDAPDPVAAILDFWRVRRDALQRPDAPA